MTETAQAQAARPNHLSTPIILIGMVLTYVFAGGNTASEMAHQYSLGVALSLGLSFAVDYRGNLRNLIRTDVLSLLSLYFFTLAEYIVPQPDILDSLVNAKLVRPALDGCLVGFFFLALGRHLVPKPSKTILGLCTSEISPSFLLGLCTFCFIGGFGYMFYVVGFNVTDLIGYFIAPRFAQPWGRGQYGDWLAIIYELNMVLYLLPPIAGTILAERRKYPVLGVAAVVFMLLFTLFYGFTTGTRNIFGTYLATFTVAYAFRAALRSKREVILLCGTSAVLMLIATVVMLEFRNIGLKAYMDGATRQEIRDADRKFYVDNNIVAMSLLMDVFPRKFDYLGFEIPWLSIIRPVPRALWPEKPKGMSISIEKALNAESLNLTVAATYIGEAYMSAGFLGIVLFSLAFGAFAGWWNHFGQAVNTEFGNLIFASGFFAAVMSMRSCLIFTTTILPTIIALFFGIWALRVGILKLSKSRERSAKDNP